MAINGKKPESLYNWTIPECNENERILYDVESGCPYKVSKEYYDKYMDMFTTMIAGAINTPDFGKIFIAGTGGGFNDRDDLKDMFYNPEKWNLETEQE